MAGSGNPQPRREGGLLRLLADQRLLHFLLIACVMTGVAQWLHQGHAQLAESIDRYVMDHLCLPVRVSTGPEEIFKGELSGTNIRMVELPHQVPRGVLGRLVAVLSRAKVVGIDLMLVDREADLSDGEIGLVDEEQQPLFDPYVKLWTQEADKLAVQFAKAGQVVCGAWPGDVAPDGTGQGRGEMELPPEPLWRSALYRAHLEVAPDRHDGVVRHVPLFRNTPDGRVPCLGLAIAAACVGVPPDEVGKLPIREGFLDFDGRRIPVTDDGQLLIDYPLGAALLDEPQHHMLYDFAVGLGDPELFAGEVVIVGESGVKGKDLLQTPLGAMPGYKVHANIVATLLSQRGPPVPAPAWQGVLLALALSLLLIVPLLRLPLWGSLVTAVGMLAVGVTVVASTYRYGNVMLPGSVPLGAVLLTYNAVAIYEYRRTRTTLGRFIGRDLLAEILHPLARLRLGGREELATAFFCDLRGYTTLSESLPPREVLNLLNAYTDTLVGIVRKHGGRPIDYFGDGVFVLFEETPHGESHALRAVRAAQEAQAAFADWSALLEEQRQPIRAGIGIHTGPMIVGLVGSEEHMKPGAVGDVVNVAARLQGLSDECGHDVLLTREAFDHAGGGIPAVACGSHPLKGRDQPVQVFGLASGDAPAQPETAPEDTGKS